MASLDLGDVVPDEFKALVAEFIRDADKRVIELARESSELKLNPKTLGLAKRRGIRGGNASSKHKSKNKQIAQARQYLIILMLSYGKTYKEMGEILEVSPAHLRNTVDRMRRHENCHNSVQLVAKAIRSGYIR